MAKNKQKSRGSALLSALFIMTLVAIAATAMTTRLQLDIYRTRLTINSDKLYLASQIVAFWAMSELNDNKQFIQADAHGKIADLPSKLANLYPNTQIRGELYDLQARFNINNLVDKKFQSSFVKLLTSKPADLDPNQAKIITLDTISWLSIYQPSLNNSELFSYYLKQKPPYYPSQQLMQHVSEFRLVRGVTAKLYQSLFDYLTALPETTAININTAAKPILMTLGNGLNEEQLSELMKVREKKGISDLKTINPLLQKLNIRGEQITIESQYFMSVAYATADDLSLSTYTILKRTKDKQGKVITSIISESLNAAR